MRDGGNAVDAAIAANAVLGMVLPTTCGIGGDLFALVHHTGDERPTVINASGRAGSGADPDALRSRGLPEVPARAPEAITVPGCVDGWIQLAERHGSLPLARLLAPAVDLGNGGFEVSAELADDLHRIAPLVREQSAAGPLYPGGDTPTAGATVRRPDLAATLAAIAAGGRRAFYEGAVARAVSAATGGLVTEDDLAANRPDWVDPVGLSLFGLDAWTPPPNSQGYLTLAAAAILELLDPEPDPQSPALHHATIEAYRAVAGDADRFVADPDHALVDPAALLDGDRLASRARTVSAHRAARRPLFAAAPGDTAYLCTIDAEGTAVSLIQSNFQGIGSGISAPGTGIFLHNRGAGFTLTPGHPNELAPGKRPFHTLSPTLWTEDGRCALLLGTRGGHHQPQYLLQMITLLLHVGIEPGAAQAAPRWHADRPIDDRSAVVVEAGMPEGVVRGLVARGHLVERRTGTAAGWGPVSVIAVDHTGVRAGAADPRIGTAKAGG
jgi:gamma-glutamyltranspeptidase / glutathione hydrolase